MRNEKMLQHLGLACAAIMLALAFTWRPAKTFADTSKDYVVVIDVSTSMQDIFDEVKRLTNRTLAKAKTGDNVALITFGERARLVDRRQIRSQADVEDLQKEVNALYPTDYATYINSGLEKSLSELRYLFEKNPDRERVLLWLSDDKDNPPGELGEEFLSLNKLREKNENFEPGREWFAYEAPLSEVKNNNLEDFVTWARRTTFRVGIKENVVNLGSFEPGNVEKKVMLTFEPRHPGAAGLEFSTGASLTDPNDPTRRIPVTITPNRIVASGGPWQQEFKVAFDGEDAGDYKGEFSFESISGPILDVEPSKVTFTAMIVPPKPEVEEKPAEPVEKPESPGLLASAKERGIIATEDRPPGLTRPEKPLTFGPLEPGKKDSKIITLYLNKEADAKSISQDLSIQLPKGINVESRVFGRKDTKLAAEITVSVDQNTQLPEEVLLQGAYEGSMRFVSNESDVQVLPINVPIRVEMNTDRVRWGKRLLPATGVGRARARRMTFDELTRDMESEEKESNPIISALSNTYSRLKSRYVLLPILGALIVLFIILVYRMRPPSELFAGELVVIKDPSDSKMKNANLKRIGSLHGKDVLTLGRSPKADIRLNHPSVSPIHCKISASKKENQTEISIAPIKGYSLKVNDVDRTDKTRLSDKDLIGIGDFILLFSNPEAQKEVVVHFLDGRTVKGTPVTWDVGSPSFELLRTDLTGAEETAEEITLVSFTDLKGVFFLQDASGGGSGIPKDRISRDELLEVTFFDGERIEGHPLTDYSDVAPRFYLVPREMPSIMYILVERNSVREAVKQRVRGEPESARSTGLLGFLRGRRRSASTE